MAKEFKILSIDGGGIQGIYPASYLNYTQEKIGESPIHRYFDMIVGTSTGGIIALALALEIPTLKILELYKTQGRKIFGWSFRKLSLGLITPKYGNKTLIQEIKSVFGENTVLGDAKCRVCIPSIDITNGRTVVFKTRHHKDYVNDFKMSAWQVAAATSAAPAYFPAFYDFGTSAYVDGGLWANNPSIIGIAEAVKLGYGLKEIKVLSLGTGTKIFHKSKIVAKLFGLLGWGSSIVDLIFQSQSQGAANIAHYLCSSNYVRIDTALPDAKANLWFSKFGLDKTSGIDDLEKFALYKAKETFTKVKSIFFNSKVNPFQPEPL